MNYEVKQKQERKNQKGICDCFICTDNYRNVTTTNDIYVLREEKVFKMKTKKKALVAAVCVLVAGVSVFGYSALSKAQYTGDMAKYIKAENYKSIEYKAPKAEKATEKEIEKRILERRKLASEIKFETKGEVQDLDRINITYTSTVDGKVVDDNKTTTILLVDTTFDEDFQKQLVGKQVGKSYDIKTKTASYKVKINSREVAIVPEYNEEFIKKDSNCKTQKEYEEMIADEITKLKEESANNEARSDFWANVITTVELEKYPDRELKHEKNKIKKDYEKLAKEANSSFDEYMESTLGLDKEECDKFIDDYAKEVVKQKVIMNYIAQKEKVTVTDKEYNEHIESILKENNIKREDFKKAHGITIEEFAEENEWRTGLLFDKVIDAMIKNK